MEKGSEVSLAKDQDHLHSVGAATRHAAPEGSGTLLKGTAHILEASEQSLATLLARTTQTICHHWTRPCKIKQPCEVN